MIIEFKTQKGISIIGYFPDQIANDAKAGIQSILDNINEELGVSANIIQERFHSDPFEKMILNEVTLNTAIDNAQSQIVVSDIDFFDIKAIDYIERLDVYMEDLERGEYNPIFESKNKFNSFNKVPKKMVYNNSRNQRVRYNRKILN